MGTRTDDQTGPPDGAAPAKPDRPRALRRLRLAAIAVLTVIVIIMVIDRRWGPIDYTDYPTTWPTAQPADVGLDRRGLQRFAESLRGKGCIVRDGKLVFTWGPVNEASDVGSSSKVLYAHLLFQAIGDGLITGVDQPVGDFVPCINELNPGQGHPDRKLTFRHLTTHTAAFGFAEPPGAAFDYNDDSMGLLWDTLVNRVYGVPWDRAQAELFEPRITKVLGFEDAFVLNGRKDGRPRISPRDFARFGQLYLQRGKWGEQQLVSAKFVDMALSDPLPASFPRTRGEKIDKCATRNIGGGPNLIDHHGCSSWLWWVNGVAEDGRRWWVDAPDDLAMALGHEGKRGLAVVPSLDLVVSWNDCPTRLFKERETGNAAFAHLWNATGE